MQMDAINYIFMIGDFGVAAFLLLLFTYLYKHQRMSRALYYAFWVGCLIGSTWEFTFMFLGPEFAHAVVEWPYGLSGWPKKLSHSIWDGGIFMVGVWLCQKLLQQPGLFERFDWRELGIMLLWGLGSELLVEYLFNGRVWIYEPLPWNPVIIPPLPGSATPVGYTLIPQAVWVVAPIVFYLALLKLMKRYNIGGTS